MIIVKEFVISERLSFTLDKRVRYYGVSCFWTLSVPRFSDVFKGYGKRPVA